MRLVIAMLAVRNTNLLQSVIRLTARTFNWLDLPKFLFFEVNCTCLIGGTPDLSNRRRQDGLNSVTVLQSWKHKMGNTITKRVEVFYYRKMFLSISGFIFCQGLCIKHLAEKQKPYTDKNDK